MEQTVWKIGFEPMTSRIQDGETTIVIFPVLQIHFKILFRETVGSEIIHESFVTPERFELSTPGLKDRCSNHLSYEIILWGSPGIEPCSPVPQTDALPNKLKKP